MPGAGATGPILRSAGLAWDLRKTEPYCGYEEYDFDVPVATEGDCYARYRLRVAEIRESLKIIEQAAAKLRTETGPVMVEDRKVAWPAQLSIGSDGMGNSLEHVRKIMGQSMESLIHHFKIVTEGFHVPRGRCTRSSSRHGGSSVSTWCPTAAPGRCACTCANPAS